MAWHQAATPYMYRRLILDNLSKYKRCLELFRQTEINRNNENTNNEYSTRDYGQYVTAIVMEPPVVPNFMKELARHCPNTESFAISISVSYLNFLLQDTKLNFGVDDDWLITVYEQCPKLQHVNLQVSETPCGLLASRQFCSQLVSLNLLYSSKRLDIPSSLSFSNLRELRYQVHSESDTAILGGILSTASNLYTLAIAWSKTTFDLAFEPPDITEMLNTCVNLEKVSLEWSDSRHFCISRFPSQISEIQLYGSCHTTGDFLTHALTEGLHLKRLFIYCTNFSPSHIHAILSANADSLEGLAYYEPRLYSLSESLVRLCRNLKCLQTFKFQPQKGGGKVGDAVSKILRHQLETLVGAYDEPCFWDKEWPQIRHLKVNMKKRHTHTKAGIQRLVRAFPNVEYLSIVHYDKDIISIEEWQNLIALFPCLKGLQVKNWQTGHDIIHDTLQYKSLSAAYDESEKSLAGNNGVYQAHRMNPLFTLSKTNDGWIEMNIETDFLHLILEMKDIYKDDELIIPEGVEVNIKSRIVTVKGPRGELTKNLRHLNMEIKSAGEKKLKFVVYHGNRKHVACIRTVRSIVNNMITGVTKGFEYKMRYVYAHFPINVIINDNGKEVEIRNFLGQKVTFRVKMLEGVTCEASAAQKDELIITGNDLDAVSQSAASIQQTTSVKNKDIRKFLDGIYVSERNVIEEAA
ncbi:hypothetical protein INT43_007277 [Umbelopsis isabellina]|uniref:Large ribosomal subunit protein uL6 alpha-beta domain-containing protein n=1 Tax=Mortierella isabellina TaxID=91625 RepID=A0A8H7UHX3_MORIS|nr:hypothetical protein INT43_007277 [Umbelopsis isabellina]